MARIFVRVILDDLVRVEPFDLRADNFPRHEAFDREGEQNRDGEQHAGKVHQIVIPAVVFQ